MRIAIDYDGTYTADRTLWDNWINSAISRGHEVICVTMRHSATEAIEMPCPVFYTNRRAKCAHMVSIGMNPDIWIDDQPHWINRDSN